MKGRILFFVLLGVLAWLLRERQTEQGHAAERLTLAEQRSDATSASLRTCEQAQARADLTLAEQRAALEARHRADQDRLKLELDALRLRAAQAEVSCLLGEADTLPAGDPLQALQAALARLSEEIRTARERISQTTGRLEDTESERAALAAALAQATAERDQLQTRLIYTQSERDQHHWYAFAARTVLDLCARADRGCADEVTRALDQAQPTWLACLRAGQETPQVVSAGRGAAMPHTAVLLRATRREEIWLQLCDPRLPEAG